MSRILLGVVGLVAASVGGVLIKLGYEDKKKHNNGYKSYTQMGGNFLTSVTPLVDDAVTVNLYYKPYCPWCQGFMPTWDTFTSNCHNNLYDVPSRIVCTKYDLTQNYLTTQLSTVETTLIQTVPTVVKFIPRKLYSTYRVNVPVDVTFEHEYKYNDGIYVFTNDGVYVKMIASSPEERTLENLKSFIYI